ncbi:MAG: indolepyruvate oxidoreductase subunit beta [Candidatus Atribacteria bacterium]|nr:indolepyruvate oxidoreductase subunit beta [Candidatus Atribacteria bacterium]MCD6349372.1 indolepyruvate oxidoreductase subunit beta [Candidatus Atribacteria bacterium]
MRGSIVLCGVGGMGILRASEIIAEVLLQQGLMVCQSEVHGMAQRGGSVVTYLRFGKEAYAPLLQRGEADFMIAFEEMEALRYIPYLKIGGTVLLNRFQLYPPGTSASDYPQDVPSRLEEARFKLFTIPATEMSLKLGDPRFTNTVLLGAFSKVFPAQEEKLWEGAILKVFRGKKEEENLRAFREGRKAIRTIS